MSGELRPWPMDLHIHSALSPCAENEMTPCAIAQRARAAGLALIAVCDHNASGNAAACAAAGAECGLSVIPGMEVQTREEVHLLCLFSSLSALERWQTTVDAGLPTTDNRPEHFGEQLLFDRHDGLIGRERRLLLTSTALTVEQVFAGVAALGGLCIPAHIDRPSFSLLGNLGLIPPGIDCCAVEISRRADPAAVRRRFPDTAALPYLIASDAHRLCDIQPGRTRLIAGAPTFTELALALAGAAGRRVVSDD